MTTSFNAFGLTLTIASVVAAAAILQWLVMLVATLLSREKLPTSGLRAADTRLVVSSVILALAWIGVFSSGHAAAANTTEAAMTTGKTHGSCAAVGTDMAANVVKQKVGDPDEIRSDEQTRGPGAVIWIYKDSRCAVHIVDDKVEFVD
ncbi:MAG TPA: hypothetical protein VF980_14350 [Thermoanaerobaculia bacterium]